MSNREAQLGVLIVDSEEKVPGRQPFHFIDDDKAVVLSDPSCVRLVFLYFRHKAVEIERKGSGEAQVTDRALRDLRGHLDSVARQLDRFRQIRTEATNSKRAVERLLACAEDIAVAITGDTTTMLGILDSLRP